MTAVDPDDIPLVTKHDPPLGSFQWMNGYQWMDALADGWNPVPCWGRDGWDTSGEAMDSVVYAHYDEPDRPMFARAVYTEGDIEMEGFTTRAERDAATDRWCHWSWKQYPGVGPDDLPDRAEDMQPWHRGHPIHNGTPRWRAEANRRYPRPDGSPAG